MLLLLLVFDHIKNGTGKAREVSVTYSSSRQTVDTLRIVHEHLNSDSYSYTIESYTKKEIVHTCTFKELLTTSWIRPDTSVHEIAVPIYIPVTPTQQIRVLARNYFQMCNSQVLITLSTHCY